MGVYGDEVSVELHALLEAGLSELCLWDGADFHFDDESELEAGEQAVMAAVRKDPLILEMSELMMEAARRIDEWERLISDLPGDHSVLLVVPYLGGGGEVDYVHSQVLALVDGIRPIRDVVAAAPIPRMEVHTLLYDGLCEGTLRELRPDELEERGRTALAEGRPVDACRLLRACIAQAPERSEALAALAEALGAVGDDAEAGRCYVQVALAHYEEERLDETLPAAREAVARDAGLEGVQVLVRCLLATGDHQGAGDVLLHLAETCIADQRYDDAYHTARKICEFAPDHEGAARLLARIYRMRGGDEGAEAESRDQVVCVSCTAVNPRAATSCSECGAALQLACLTCGRPAVLSDNLCIFCGAHPHERQRQRRGLGRGPSTTAVLNRAGGEVTIDTATVRRRLEDARGMESHQDFAAALAMWRGIAEGGRGGAEVHRHIRALEAIVNDFIIEERIAQANQHRRRRQFIRARHCYRRVLRTLASDDPRRGELTTLSAVCRRQAVKAWSLYGASLLLIACGTWFALGSMVARHLFERDVAAFAAVVEATVQQPPRQRLATLPDIPDGLGDRLRLVGEDPQPQLAALAARRDQIRRGAIDAILSDAEGHLASGAWPQASAEAGVVLPYLEPEDRGLHRRYQAVAEVVDGWAAVEKQLAAAMESDRYTQALTMLAGVPDQLPPPERARVDGWRQLLQADRDRHQAGLGAVNAALTVDLQRADQLLAEWGPI
ncbi:MAG: hypothetical protein ACYTF0_08660, partial [Planctomycetota bacterium]